MKFALTLIALLSCINAQASNRVLQCKVTENWVEGDVHQELSTIFRSDEISTSFNLDGSLGFNVELKHFKKLRISAITQIFDNKEWIQAGIQQEKGDAYSAQFSPLSFSMNPSSELNTAGDWVQTVCSVVQ